MNTQKLYKPVYGMLIFSVLAVLAYSLVFMTDVTGAVTESFKGMGVEAINEFNRFMFYLAFYSVVLTFCLLLFGIPNKIPLRKSVFVVTLFVCLFIISVSVLDLVKLIKVITVYKDFDYESLNMMLEMYGIKKYTPTTRFMTPGYVLFPLQIICAAFFIVISYMNSSKGGSNDKA